MASSKPAWKVSIGEIVSEHARVEILPETGETTPVHFELIHLRVQNFEAGSAADFSASLITSQPRAQMDAVGRLGPWNAENPSLSPLSGKFTMPRCNLAELPGLQGALSSEGQFHGVLQRIEIAGDADASEFGLSVSGHPQPLRANFQATMNASDGSAAIEQLNGTLQHSTFRAQGTVRDIENDQNRNISMTVSMSHGRLEDIIPLAIKSKTSPLSGAVQVDAKLEIAPGDQDILKRLRLNGGFAVENARFSSFDLREQLRNVSRKASGHPRDPASGSSLSSMQGHVQLDNGTAQFTNLVVNLEDASARLTGSYQLGTERLDFHGQLWMAARLSQTTTGMKALFLKAADPFFRGKGGGSQVPVKITGTRFNPSFGIDLAAKK